MIALTSLATAANKPCKILFVFFNNCGAPITNIVNPNPFSIYVKKTVVCKLP